ncbi:hypothetical protein PP651_gp06 [Aeromonas phage ZPAH14]|uniref:Uncharacterized protein n=1 Tax=Aeromonas phage ZPAH14 TaxID=2924887 RepID=A0AAE9GXJ0_9CAUD|nr:hypothetical protein PP651_gp06 [Aeromonas phage ZPAH14]UOT57998.1 hypothetical protein [Aeromonas phage ZPAH14]
MIAKKLGSWGPDYKTYVFKTKSAAKRFMKSLGFSGREIEDAGTNLESHGYKRGKLPFGRFFPATYAKGYKYTAHVRHK